MSNMENICNVYVSNVDKESWAKFRGQALLNGWNSGSDWLRHLIKEYADGEHNETK